MPLVQYILRPLSAFHFSTGREDDPADLEDLPRSDTLVSSILSVWRHAAPTTSDSAIEAMAGNPPFAVSSAMPTLECEGRFEPLLFVPPGLAERATTDDLKRKLYRKARFADAGSLHTLLKGESLPSQALLVSDSGWLLHPDPPPRFDADLSSREVWEGRLWLRESRPRLSIDRMTGRATEGILFRYASTVFRSDVSLTMLAEFRDPSCRLVFETALRLLGQEGIGGGRSIGHGLFSIDQVTEGFESRLGTGARILVSLLHPTRTEIDDGLLNQSSAYTFVARGGWAERGGRGAARRKAINMLAEGSVVRDLGAQRLGDSVCVLDAGDALPHPVYRSGCALTIPIEWSGN